MASKELNCCVCKNDDENKFTLYYDKVNYKVMQCTVCSFVFVPTSFRKNITYTDYKDASVTEQVRKGNNWIKIQRHLLRYDLIEKYKPSGKLFDLGAGWGHFLLAGKQCGYDVYGIELSEQPAYYAKNDLQLPVDRIDFFAMSEENKFDIITLWDVLEHIDAADTVLEKCYRLLNKDGIIVIQVPQIDSSISKRFKENWKMISLDHVNYFSKKTLPQLLESRGFIVKEIRTSVELKLFLMYTLLPFIRKIFPKRRKIKQINTSSQNISSADRQAFFNKFTSAPKWILRVFVFFHNIIYKILGRLKIGEEMIIVAQKN
ncbi:MAG: class I SAM-dependent methyltransferase [Fimbriimonadaceae bacterium]|nr:class I SAM-dependent methyltransferase [Chitinophagales bacterium]